MLIIVILARILEMKAVVQAWQYELIKTVIGLVCSPRRTNHSLLVFSVSPHEEAQQQPEVRLGTRHFCHPSWLGH